MQFVQLIKRSCAELFIKRVTKKRNACGYHRLQILNFNLKDENLKMV